MGWDGMKMRCHLTPTSPTPTEKNGLDFRGVSYGFEPLGAKGCLERREDDVSATVEGMRVKLEEWIVSQRGSQGE